MKRLLAIAMTAVFLSGCGAQIVRFDVKLRTENAYDTKLVREAIDRSIEGRLAAKGKELISKEETEKNGTITITVKVSDAEAAAFLREALTTPFSMELMKQVGKGEGDIVSEKFGEFKETGITTKHFDWVAAGPMPPAEGVDGKVEMAGKELGAVEIKFTPEGQTLLKEVFRKNVGGVVGVFVRGVLMSKKLVDKNDKQEVIAVDNIPSVGLAQAFADDVNIGLHTTITVLP